MEACSQALQDEAPDKKRPIEPPSPCVQAVGADAPTPPTGDKRRARESSDESGKDASYEDQHEISKMQRCLRDQKDGGKEQYFPPSKDVVTYVYDNPNPCNSFVEAVLRRNTCSREYPASPSQPSGSMKATCLRCMHPSCNQHAHVYLAL